jgi:hypothetical protein
MGIQVQTLVPSTRVGVPGGLVLVGKGTLFTTLNYVLE